MLLVHEYLTFEMCTGIVTCKSLGALREDKYAHIAYMPGGLHGCAHVLIYPGQSSYAHCLLMPAATALGFKKILPKPTNLEYDTFDNHKCFQLSMALCCKYLLLKKYGQMCSKRLQVLVATDATDLTMYQFLLQVGGPLLEWVKSTRGNNWPVIDKLWEWGFFLGYANHKTQYNQIAIIRAHTRYCLHPKLRPLVAQEQTVSKSGRMGANVECDEDVESLNNDIQRFCNGADSYEVAMIFCEHYSTLQHVDRVYMELLGLDQETPLDARTSLQQTFCSMLNWMEKKINLHAQDPNSHNINAFTSTLLLGGDERLMQPWQHIYKCAIGTSAPVGFPRGHKHYNTYVQDYCNKNYSQ